MTTTQINAEICAVSSKRSRALRLAEEALIVMNYHCAKVDLLGLELRRLGERLAAGGERGPKCETGKGGAGEKAKGGAGEPEPVVVKNAAGQPVAIIRQAEHTAAAVIGGQAQTEGSEAKRGGGETVSQRAGARPSPLDAGPATPPVGRSGARENPGNIATVRDLPEPFSRQAVAVALGKAVNEATLLLNRWKHKGWVNNPARGLWQKTQSFGK